MDALDQAIAEVMPQAPAAPAPPAAPPNGDDLAQPDAAPRAALWGVRKRDVGGDFSGGDHPLPTSIAVREPDQATLGAAPSQGALSEEDILQRAGAAAPLAHDQLDDAISSVMGAPDRDAQFLAWKSDNAGVDPAQAREVLRYSEASGLAPAFVAKNLDAVRKQTDASGLDLGAVLERNPALKDWLGADPMRPAAAKDDLGPLDALSQAMQHPFDVVKGVGYGAAAGVLGLGQSYHDLRDLYGGTAEQRQKADALGQEMESLRDHVSTPLGRFALANAEQLPMLAGDYALRFLGGRLGQSVGEIGAAGEELAGGGPEDPAADVAAAASIVGGRKGGEVLAGLGYQVGLNQAQLYRQLHEVKDANGQPLDPDLQKGMAMVGGALAGGLMTLAGGPLGATGEAAVREQALQMVEKSLLEQGALGRLTLGAKRFGVHYLTGIVVMSGQAAMNAATVEGAKEISGETYDARAGRILEAAEQGFISAAEGLPLAAGLSAVADVHAAVGRAVSDQQLQLQNQQLFDAANKSKTVAEVPDQAGELAKRVADQPGAVAAAHIDKAQWDRYWQDEQKADPREAWVALTGDGGQGYDQVTGEKGTELRMPAEKYIPFLKTDAARALIDDVRLTGQTETARQTKARAAQVERRMQELARSGPERLDDSARQVYEDLAAKTQFASHGSEPDLEAAAFTARKMQAVAESFAADPAREGPAPTAWDLYAANPPAIVDEHGRGLPDRPWEELPVAPGSEPKSGVVPTEGDMARAAQLADRLGPERQQGAHAFLDYVRRRLAGEEVQRPTIPNDLEDKLAAQGVTDPAGYVGPEERRGETFAAKKRASDARRQAEKMRGHERVYQEKSRGKAQREVNKLKSEAVEPEHPAVTELRNEFTPHLDQPESEVALRRYFEDPVTGLRNERAAALEPADAERSMVLRFAPEGVKYRNDDLEKGGHHKADELVRAVGEQASALDPLVSRAGGDFELRVRDEAHAKDFLEKLRAAMPKEAGGYGLAGEVGATGKEAGEKLGKVNETAEESGARAKRGERPFNLKEGEDAGTTIPGKRIKAELGQAHRDAFERLRSTPEGREQLFQAIHVEPTTKLLTRVGHDVRKVINPQPFRASIDLNGLKRLNKAVSKEFGNRLLEKFGQLAAKRGLDFDFAHDHGDEYLAQGPSRKALEDFLNELFADALQADVSGPGEKNGVSGTYTYKELLFGHGISEAHDERGAERELNKRKAKLTELGQRGNEDQPPRLEWREGARGPDGDSHQGRGGLDADDVRGGAGGGDALGADARDGRGGGPVPPAEGGSEGEAGGREGGHGEVALGDRTEAELYRPDEGGSFRLNSKRGRGYIEFTPPGEGARKFTIHLEKGADASTLTHELTHWFGEVLGDLAQRPDAPERLKSDYQTLLDFMGYGSHEERLAAGKERRGLQRSADAGTATEAEQAQLKHLTAKEERLAHGWEQYLLEGKSPSVELAPVFARFKRWLTGIYSSLKTSMGVDAHFRRTFGEALGLNNQVRQVFDRYLASDEQMDRAHEVMGATSFDELRAKMPPEQQAKYDEDLERARGQASADLAARIGRATANEDSSFFQEKAAELRPEVERQVDQVPVNRTLRFLEKGDLPESPGKTPELLSDGGKPFKVDRKSFVKKYGADVARRMPKALWDAAGEGVPVDELSEMLGWHSPDEMIAALDGAPSREQVIHDEVQRRLEETYGSRLLDSPHALADEALQAAHTPAQASVVLQECRALAHELNPERATAPLDLGMVRRHAERIVGNLPVSDITAGRFGAADRFLRQERTAARQAQEAYRKGDVGAALEAKDTQLLSMLLYRAARDARERIESQRRTLQQASRLPWQTALGKADVAAQGGPFRAATNAVLEAVGMRPNPDGELPEPKALDALVGKVGTEALGFDPGELRPLLERPVDWGELKPDQVQLVHDALKSIRHHANDQLELDVAGKRQLRETWLKDLATAAASKGAPLPPVSHTPGGAGVVERIQSFTRGLDAWLTSISSYVESLDGGDRNGPAHRLFLDEHLDRLVVRADLDRQVLAGVRKAIEALPAKLKGSMNERVAGLSDLLPMRPEWADQVKPPSTRADLWTLRLRWGDAENRQRIRDGNGWGDAQVQRALELLSPQEHEFLQGLADTIEGLWEPLAKAHEARTGLPLGKVEATPITAGGKEYRGGYFPIVYDPRLSREGVYQASAVEQALFGNGASPPRVFTGHTKERALLVKAPVGLDFGTVQVHLAQAAHDIAMGDWVRKAAGLVMDPSFKRTVDLKLGHERTSLFMPWLRDIAADRAGSMAGAFDATPGAISTLENMASRRMALMAVGLNLKSMVMHLSDPWQALMARNARFRDMPERAARISSAWGKTLATYLPGAEARPEWAQSKELQVRDARETENLRKALQELGGSANPTLRKAGSMRRAVEDFSNHLRFHLDQFHYRAIWTAGYEEGLAKGMAPAEAARHGDDFVAETLPSGEVSEKPAVMRSKRGFSQLAAILYGYANKMWNLRVHRPVAGVVDTFRSPQATGWQKASSVADLAAKWVVMGAIGAGSKAAVGQGPQEDGDKHKVPWLARQVLLEEPATIPILGPALEGLSEDRKVDERTLPGASATAAAVERARKLIDGAVSGEGSDADAWDAVDLIVGQGTGFGAQVHRTASYLQGVQRGDVEPSGPLDAAWGALITGKPHRR